MDPKSRKHRVQVANRTKLLIVLLVLVSSMQAMPAYARLIQWIAVGSLALYALATTGRTWYARHVRRSREVEQTRADEIEYRQYCLELDDIRARHDGAPGAEPGSMSGDEAAEVSALHRQHREMLSRRFGPHASSPE